MYSILTLPNAASPSAFADVVKHSPDSKFKACAASARLTAYLHGKNQPEDYQLSWTELDVAQMRTHISNYAQHVTSNAPERGMRLHTFYDLASDQSFFIEALFAPKPLFESLRKTAADFQDYPLVRQRVYGCLAPVYDPETYDEILDVQELYTPDDNFRVLTLPLREVFDVSTPEEAFDELPPSMFDLDGGFFVVQVKPGQLTRANRSYAVAAMRQRTSKKTRLTGDIFDDTKHLYDL